MTFPIHPFKDTWGVAARVLVNFGVNPSLDFRAGLTADASGSFTSYMGLGVTAALRVNLGSVYSLAIGGGAGMLTDTRSIAPTIGPEWSILSLRLGSRRQVELALDQGVHFHVSRGLGEVDLTRFQSAIVLTYLFLDHAP